MSDLLRAVNVLTQAFTYTLFISKLGKEKTTLKILQTRSIITEG